MAGVKIDDKDARIDARVLLQNKILLPYADKAEEALYCLERPRNDIPSGPKDTLVKRWRQIKEMIRQASEIAATDGAKTPL